ncbi:MAG: efflux RND transporter permease subunit [Dehalogenimonas sp.]
MMQFLFVKLADIIIKHPIGLISGILAITMVFAGFATQSVTVQEIVTEDNELTQALDTISEVFGESTSVLQVVLETNHDIRSVESLKTLIAIEETIRNSNSAATLISSGQQPAIVSFLSGAKQTVESTGMDLASLDDEMVLMLQEQSLQHLPQQYANLFEGLIGVGNPPTAGLMLVFQDTAGLDNNQVIEQQQELADIITAVNSPPDLKVTPFGFGLLLTASDPGPEIGRLFGMAMLIILLVLAIVYWIRPQAGQRRMIIGRTFIDVILTLAIILMAVVWMQGAGVLLGPDYLNIIGYFSPQTQVVPILIVGLGVDFGIHILSRYRFELSLSGKPEDAFRISLNKTGFTLLLATGATAIGFLTNLASPVSFLATLGVLAAVGITAAFIITVTFLPAIRFMLDRRAAQLRKLPLKALAGQSKGRLSSIAERAAWLAERVPVITVVVALLLTALGGYGFTQLKSEFNLTDFVPRNEPLLTTFDTLTNQFDGGFEERTQVLIEGELGTSQVHNALIEAIGAAGNVPGVQKVGEFTDANSIASVIGQAFTDELGSALISFGIDENLMADENTNVVALYDFLIKEAPGATQVIAHGQGSTFITRVDIRTTGGQNGAADLATDLNQVFATVKEMGIKVTTTSQSIAQARQSESIENSQVLSLLIALGGAMLLLIIHFTVYARRPFVGVITVLPVVLVLALTFGTMTITGIPINPVTATLAALSIGIAVPFTIHLTSRFLEERNNKPDCNSALRQTLSQTGGALAGSALTTAIGFGILITSTLIPFQQLGLVIVYAITFSLIASILVLPSLLVLWDANDRRRHGLSKNSGCINRDT